MHTQLYSIRELPAGQVSVMAHPRGGDQLLDEIKALRETGVDILVSLLTSDEIRNLDLAEEAAFCHSQGITFFSFPIPDLNIPPFSPPTFMFLEQLHTQLLEGKHIVLHCRQGIGRSGLMAANLLLLGGFPPEQACELLSKVRGYPVPWTEEQLAWVVAFYDKNRTP
jgi:protein-tyrosine phosphatase